MWWTWRDVLRFFDARDAFGQGARKHAGIRHQVQGAIIPGAAAASFSTSLQHLDKWHDFVDCYRTQEECSLQITGPGTIALLTHRSAFIRRKLSAATCSLPGASKPGGPEKNAFFFTCYTAAKVANQKSLERATFTEHQNLEFQWLPNPFVHCPNPMPWWDSVRAG